MLTTPLHDDPTDRPPPRPAGEKAADRPVRLRRRHDLTVVPQNYGRHRYWLVKDPLSLQYFHLREEEHAILDMLDGRTGLAAIKARFEKRFAPLRLPLDHLHAFLGRLHQCGLVLSDAPGQAESLLERDDAGRKRRRLAAWVNVLAIRFRGFDLQSPLKWLAARCGWLVSPMSLVLVFVLAAAAAAAVAVHWPRSSSGVDLRTMLHPGNLLWLAAVLATAKVLHELGHAITCIRLGGQCRELGLMLLVFTPCLYCEVSDAWTFPSKWRRIAVSAAGIVVEIVLASLAALVWCYSPPGTVHDLSSNVMVVCSVSTLLFNGNPLMRYDGYYVLADLIEVPNLAEQSWDALVQFAAFVFLGIRQAGGSVWPVRGRFLLGFYGLASLAYRCFAVCAILWGVHRVTAAYNVAAFGDAIAIVVLAGVVMPIIRRSEAFLNAQRLARRPAWLRMFATAGFWLTLLIAIAFIPWPSRFQAPLVIEPESAHRVYAVIGGTLLNSASAGDRVEKGQEVARLANSDIRREVVELTGKRDLQRRQLAALRARQALDSQAAALIPTAEAALADLESRLSQRQRDEESLVLRAPAAGIVLQPGNLPADAQPPGQLPAWSGSPLDEQNRGCQIEPGTLVCMVGSPSPVEALVAVDQDSIALVHLGQLVYVSIESQPGEVDEGRVVEIASRDLKVAPRELASGTDLSVRVDRQGIARPTSVTYEVRVRLTRQPGVIMPGSRGQAKFLAEPQSLAARIRRALQQNVTIRW